MAEGKQRATFGAGCFWCVELTFSKIKGVLSTQVGYMGGSMDRPTYRDVCTGRTDHAEVVDLEFDPSTVTYSQLLDAFWSMHDPTTLNRQGPDVGTQYRSVIFYHSPQQKAEAEASRQRAQASKMFKNPIVTEIVLATNFWRAEEYHQKYLEKRHQAACRI